MDNDSPERYLLSAFRLSPKELLQESTLDKDKDIYIGYILTAVLNLMVTIDEFWSTEP